MTSRHIDGHPSMTPTKAAAWLRHELGIETSASTIRRMCDQGTLRHVLVETSTAGRPERHTTGAWLRAAFVIETTEDTDAPRQPDQDETARAATAMALLTAMRKGGAS